VSNKAQRPPTGEPWVWLTRELLASPAWQSLSINARRFLDFLMIEHMRHAGKANGSLLAPYNQLERFGISRRLIGRAIEETQQLGLVDCRRGFGRSPSSYALTWLPFGDDGEPSNRWRLSKLNGLASLAVHEGEPLREVYEGEPVRCTKVNHKACSSARR
jgi:hypothetical protein